MQNIKAIIFDLGGVILNIDYNKTRNAFGDLGVKNFDEMYSQKNANPLFHDLEEGKINEAEFYNAFRKSTHPGLTDQQIKTAWNAMLLDYREEALQTLTIIKHKYRMYLLSNTNSIHLQAFNKIYKDGNNNGVWEDYFDKIYYSHEIGYRKPGNEAYDYVLKENKLIASETLFIDDSLQNINAAKALGLQTIFLEEGMKVEDLEL